MYPAVYQLHEKLQKERAADEVKGYLVVFGVHEGKYS